MNLIKSPNADINYLSKVVQIDHFQKHIDPEVVKLKVAEVDGFKVIVGIDAQPGLYIYFPALSQINPELLTFANLYRHADKNKDNTKQGLFNDNGKVTTIKLRGQVSEGFLLEAEIFQDFILSAFNQEIKIEVNTEFDSIEHNGKTAWISKKYRSIRQYTSTKRSDPRGTKRLKQFSKIVISQFRFHYDTTLIRKVPHVIQPEDIISITSKIHGTSVIAANVICRFPYKWYQKPYVWLSKLVGLNFPCDNYYKYDYVYASRKVIKNEDINANASQGYYNSQPYYPAFKIMQPHLKKGMTMYAEIVGYCPDGSPIQGKFDYGCVPPEDGKYIHEKNFKVRIYRITLTNADGEVHEFSAREVQQYCNSVGLVPVTQWYYGFARDLYPDIKDWNKEYLDRLASDARFYMEKPSPECINRVPQEGIVIKKENGRSEAWKLKTFAFLSKESNNEMPNIEDEQ